MHSTSLIARAEDAFHDFRTFLQKDEDVPASHMQNQGLSTEGRVLPIICMGKGGLAAA